MTDSADPEQLASVWVYPVCKGRTYAGSAGLGLIGSFIT